MEENYVNKSNLIYDPLGVNNVNILSEKKSNSSNALENELNVNDKMETLNIFYSRNLLTFSMHGFGPQWDHAP